VTPPLVLLHGFTGSPDSWAAVRRHLAADDDVFAPAIIGHDGTPGRPDIRSFHDEVDRLADLMLARGLDRPHVAGYSLGGRLALGLLVRHAALFRSATLMGVSPGLADRAEREARGRQDEEQARLLEAEGLPTFVAAWEALPLWDSQGDVPAKAWAHQRRIRLSHDPHGLATALRVTGLAAMPDYRPALGGIGVPVRVVAGEKDEKFVALARELAERLPRGTLRVVADAGHNVVLERPAEIARMLEETET
jgi:2-succinyl-6-hydroxy-2,4-cyclohexadiene-1-carboxylate synthase